MSKVILAIGLMVFFAHFLSLQFRRTNIPDVLVLMLVGILIGPLLGWMTPADFGRVGPLIAAIALVVILFEGGTTLNIGVLAKALTATGMLAINCFILSTLIITLFGFYVLELGILPAVFLGVILGSTAASVVIPLAGALDMAEKPATVVVLESAFTDVLSIVAVFALIQIHTQGEVEAGHLVGSILSAMVFAVVIGVAGGIGWLVVLGKVRDFPNTISSTLAYVFIVYGFTELLGFSGAIAALALGVALTNAERFGLHHIPSIDRKIVPLNEIDLMFYREAVFLLKTYFFVYLGISIRFGDVKIALVALAMVLVIYVMRVVLVRYIVKKDESYTLKDAAYTSMLAPKGLASAVLATLPVKYGVAGGEMIRDVTFMVVLISITITALLVMALPLPAVRRFYGLVLGKSKDI